MALVAGIVAEIFSPCANMVRAEKVRATITLTKVKLLFILRVLASPHGKNCIAPRASQRA